MLSVTVQLEGGQSCPSTG